MAFPSIDCAVATSGAVSLFLTLPDPTPFIVAPLFGKIKSIDYLDSWNFGPHAALQTDLVEPLILVSMIVTLFSITLFTFPRIIVMEDSDSAALQFGATEGDFFPCNAK